MRIVDYNPSRHAPWVLKRPAPERERLRAKAFELFGWGYRNRAVAEMLGIPYITAQHWRTRFRNEGPDGASDKRLRRRAADADRLRLVDLPALARDAIRKMAFRLFADGRTIAHVSGELHLSAKTVKHWHRWFRSRGAGSPCENRRGSKPGVKRGPYKRLGPMASATTGGART